MPKKKTTKSSSKMKKVASRPPPKYYGTITSAAAARIRRTAQASDSGVPTAATSPQSMSMSPLYYDYRWSTPDKFYFPRSRATANRIFREIYLRDAAVATATDMYSDLPWSKFDLIGIDDSTVRKVYEDMFNALNLPPKLQNFTRDYIITGELVLHSIINSAKGIWERVISHNPDYIRVEGLGLAFEQPLLWMKPTPEIKKLINSKDPRVRKFLQLIPKEIVNSFRANREVILDPLNTTFIPRLNTSNNVRGTSLYTRLFRVIMYEDFVVNASLACAQRNAGPLRIFKLGDPNTGWVPSEEDEQRFSEMLSMAESDPMAAIIWHNGVNVDLIGVSDRILLISREWDFIERVKLLALGVSKAFLVGEASFACFEKGTPVLLGDGTPVPIEDINTGDIVLDQNGEQKKVINNWCEGVPSKLLEIRAWGGRKFRVTPNHRFPAWIWPRKCSCGCGEDIGHLGRLFRKDHAGKICGRNKDNIELKKVTARIHEGRHPLNRIPVEYEPDQIVYASELKSGDYLKIPITYNEIESKVNEDEARLLGYYLAEGSISYYKRRMGEEQSNRPCMMRLSFGLHEKETWVKDVKRICKRLGFRFRSVRPNQHGKPRNVLTVTVVPKDKGFLDWIVKHAGQRSYSKKLSEEVMSWPKELLEELVRGYFRGDGSRKSKPSPAIRRKKKGAKTLACVQVGTVSEVLATQMMMVLARLGFPAGHAAAAQKPPRKTYHILRVTGNHAVKLCKLIWDETLNVRTTTGNSYQWQDDKFIHVKIQSIEEIPNDQPVYNLEVEGSHTYTICDGIATCNSAIAGLQTLLERLAALRNKFEQDWMISRLCEPIAQMHGFYQRSKSEIEHRIRIDRPENRIPIVPQIRWHKSLEPVQDVSVLSYWDRLYEYGIVSKRTYCTGAGVNLEQERKNIIEETKYEHEKKRELEGLGFEVPPEEEAGGSLMPPPAPPAGASRKTGRYNPYLDKQAQMRKSAEMKRLHAEYSDTNLDEVEEELENIADRNHRIHVEDAIDIIRGSYEKNGMKFDVDKKLTEVERLLPKGGVGLLTGT